jgi:hypothetical protein
MLPHVLSHADKVYVLSFRQIDGFWVAGLYRRGDFAPTILTRFPEAKVGGLSDAAIRAGYIAVANHIVSAHVESSDAAAEIQLHQEREAFSEQRAAA